MTKALEGKVAVVTGSTRGCGRGIAVELGAAGATVYVTGRTTRERRSPVNRPETIEDTAELVTAAGGRGVAVRTDFTVVSDVDNLRDRIESEQAGLDILVDDVWGGENLVRFNVPHWESNLDEQLTMVHNGIDTHLIALHRLLPLVVRRPGGLVLEVTDGEDNTYHGTGIAYHVVKSGMRAIGQVLGTELAKYGCTGLTITPGFLRSEQMLANFGVTEENWRDAAAKVPSYIMSETPRYLGRAVAALAADPDVSRFAGRAMSSWALMREYGFTDVDGSRPDWGRFYEEVVKAGTDPATIDVSTYR